MTPRAAALFESARARASAGELSEAIGLLTEMVREDPESYEAHVALGQNALRLKHWQRAEASFAQAALLKPHSAAARTGLGYALRGLARHDEALQAFEAALERSPGSATCLGEIAATCIDLGDIERARSALSVALEANADSAALHDTCARLLMVEGDLDVAAVHLRRALTLHPGYSPSLLKLAKLGRLHEATPCEELEALLERADLHDAERRNVAFALGITYERAGDYDRAFASFAKGNDAQLRLLQATGGGYRPGQREQEVARLVATYSERHLRAWNGRGHASAEPIFVIGMPRSGTTLVEQILASHPAVRGAGELPYLGLARQQFEKFSTAEDGRILAAVPGLAVQRIAAAYLDRVRQAAAGGSAHFVDKNPHNFENVGLIRVLLPRARVIHCLRDPVDTCLSAYCEIFSREHDYNNRLEDLGHYFGQYLRLMRHWQQVAGEIIHTVRYEQLVRNPREEVTALLAHCGLDFHPACLEFHTTRRPINTPSQLQVRRALYASSVNRAQPYRAHLGRLLAALESSDALGEAHA